MSKYATFITLLLVIFFVLPPVARAASISPIGDIKPEEAKTVTISGLDANQKYYWVERKWTIAVHPPGQDPYTTIYTDCYDSDNASKIVRDLGPYHTPGFYKLIISKASDRDNCSPSLGQIESQEFWVGGHTDQPCCNFGRPVYNSGTDMCEKIALISKDPDITDCAKMNPPTYCEPGSLRCFESKTYTLHGKVCKDPKDSGFDKNKNAVCTYSGGQTITGCSYDPKNPSAYDPNNPGIATAIGCIHTNPTEFIKDLLKFVIGISGGLAFLMMLLGAFQMLTSAGNPETLNAGRDRLTSAVIGLLFVIFAILLLQIIGVGILNIPGFK